jgi:peptide/nickel transport system substrate-binding protein
MDRRTFIALSLLALPACRDTRTPGDALPEQDRIVVLFPEALRGTLDPRLNTRAWPGKIIHLVFEGLTSVNNPRLAPEPALAERIEQPAPAVYDITLRASARFQDGAPVTATDVVATLESIRDPQLGSPLRSVHNRIARLEVLGPRRLRITLKEPHAPYLSDLSVGILPARLIGAQGQLTGPLIGAGPYRIHSRSDQREVVLRRHEGYWRGTPVTPYLVVRAVADQNTRLLALLGGAADLVQNAVSPRMADAMRGRPGLAVDTFPGVAYAYVAFNLRRGPLADPRVRQAIALAVNRERLIEHKFRGVARVASGMLPEGHWAYAPDVARYPHDPARARALLAEAGHPNLSLSLKVNTDKFRRNIARLIAADLAEVGITLKVQGFEVGTLLADVKSGNFDLYMLQWGDPSEPHFYNWIFHGDRVPTPKQPNRGGNRGAYVEPEVDRLIDAGRVAAPAGRPAIYQKLQRILARDVPYLSLWHEDVVVIRRTALKGYVGLPNASLFGLWQAGRQKV